MLFEQKFTVPTPRARAWAFLLDVPALGPCMPGVEKVETLDDRNYQGLLKVKVGPISLNLEWKATFEHISPQDYTATVAVQGTDKRVGGAVRAKITMRAQEVSAQETEVSVNSDVSVLGKLGQFGYGIMKKKADDMLGEFASRIRTKLT